ncbi:MAG: DUF4136 domain-containing protein [Pacificimonas sp.]
MRHLKTALLPLAALAALSACATGPGGTDVTRFHVNAPMSQGTVFLEPVREDRVGTLEFNQYRDAIAAELAAAGFTPVRTKTGADLVGRIDYGQTTREGLPGRSPVSVGVGGGTAGRNVGIGLGTVFGLGKKKNNDVAVSTLELRMVRTADNSPVWEGRAVTEAREETEEAALSAAIPALARDLLRDFPGESGETVRYE